MAMTDPDDVLGELSTIMLDRARLPLPPDWETGSDPASVSELNAGFGPLRWAAAPDRRFALERRTRWTSLHGADWDSAVRDRAAAFLTEKGWDEMIETIRTTPVKSVFNLRFLDPTSDRPGSGQWAAGENEPSTGMLYLGERCFLLADSREAQEVWQETLDSPWQTASEESDATRWLETNRADRSAFYTCLQIEDDKERAFKHRWVLAQHHRNLLLIAQFVLYIGAPYAASGEFCRLVARLQEEVVVCGIEGLDELVEGREAPSPWRGCGLWRAP